MFRPVSLSLQTIRYVTEEGSTKANGREPKSSLCRALNFKIDSFVAVKEVCNTHTCVCIKLKTWPRFRTVSLSLSTAEGKKLEELCLIRLSTMWIISHYNVHCI